MKNSIQITVMLRAIDLELKAILEKDLKRFKTTKQIKQNQTAFMQLIAA